MELTEQKNDLIHTVSLFSIILIEGFVTISVEILTIRQLLPFVGNSVVVTSLIIGVFLLFLALGYRKGGTYTGNYRQILLTNFTRSMLLLGVGLSYYFCILFFNLSLRYVTHQLLFMLSAYLLLIIAPLVYFLGQTVPITTNLFKQEARVGAVSGKVLYLSTMGSFLGAVLTTLFLFNYFGVAWTVFINTILLATLSFMLMDDFAGNVKRIVLIVLGIFCFYVLNIEIEQNWFLKTNNYANYRIDEAYEIQPNNFGKVFEINHVLSSFLNDKKKGAPYLERIKKILFKDLKLRRKHILVLGAGGFTLGEEDSYSNDIDYVDIDKDIAKIAKQGFIKQVKGRFIPADARLFVKQHPAQYDVVVSDTYKSTSVVPAYLLTREYLQDVRGVLVKGGIAVFNFIANPLLDDPYSKRIDNTVQTVFSSCMKIPLEYADHWVNIIYVCQLSPVENDKKVYTDDLNSASLDFFKYVV